MTYFGIMIKLDKKITKIQLYRIIAIDHFEV